MFWDGYKWAWSFLWAHSLRPRDLVERSNLVSLLDHVHLRQLKEDNLSWLPYKSGLFSTISFSQELIQSISSPSIDAMKGLWRVLVPHRIEIFVWPSILGKINTKCNLVHLGIMHPSSEMLCVLCNKLPKDATHLMVHCSFSSQLWQWWLNLWGLSWVSPLSLKELFDQWNYPSSNPFLKKI